MLCNLGLVWHVQGRSIEALDLLARSLQTAREIGQARLEVTALCNLGIVEESIGRLEDASAHLCNGLDIAKRLGDSRAQGQVLSYLGLVQTRTGFTQAGRSCLDVGGKLLGVSEEDSDLGVLYCCSALAFVHTREILLAIDALQLAEEIKDRLGDSGGLDLSLALDRARQLVNLPS